MGRTVPAVNRAIDILELFLAHQTLSAPEVTQRLGLPRTTVHELLTTLTERQYLVPVSDQPTRYRLGIRLFQPRADQLDHQVVRDEIASVVDVLDAPAQVRAGLHLRAEDLAARDVRDPVFRRDALCLRALARTLRAEEQDVQRHGVT